MAMFEFKTWCNTNGLQDCDTSEALVLVAQSDVAILDMTLGQRKLLTKAIGEL